MERIRKLGANQRLAMDSLRRLGSWPGAWVMDSPSYTERVLKALVRRGFVVKTVENRREVRGGPLKPVTVYRLSAAGKRVNKDGTAIADVGEKVT